MMSIQEASPGPNAAENTARAAEPAPTACPSRGRPIDLVHLAHQTLGDRALEREVLDLMAQQIRAFGPRLSLAQSGERQQIAHAIKGAARNVGAFALAEAAARLEQAPDAETSRTAFEAEMARTLGFIASL